MPEAMDRNAIEEVILQKLQVMGSSIINREEVKCLKDLTVHPIFPDNMDAIILQMTAWVWAQKPERKEVCRMTFLYPDGWFNHLKSSILEKFPKLRKLGIHSKLKEYEVKGEFDCQVVYPKLDRYEAGPHLIVTKLVKDTWRFDKDFN